MPSQVEQQALSRQVGKVVSSIQHHDIIGTVEIHFTDGSCVSVHADGKAMTSLMITEPKEKVKYHS
ncbi:hypothetical protein NTE19_003332 [Vibrio fluvialis]|nr:hypothetical protein [Vibrio fluvialis]